MSSWDSDTAHKVRFFVNACTGALLILNAVILLPIVLARRSRFPLRAHGLFFVISKLLGMAFVGAYFVSFMPLKRVFISLFLCFMPLFYLFPTILRCWTIYFTMTSTKLKLKISNAATKVSRIAGTDTVNENKLRRAKFLLRKRFQFAVFVGLLILTGILYTPTIPLFLLITSSSFYSLIYGIVIAGLGGAIYCICIIVLLIMIVRQKLKENFNIFTGIVLNCVIVMCSMVSLVPYGVQAVVDGAIQDSVAREVIYGLLIIVDVLIQVLAFADSVISCWIPVIRTYFWVGGKQRKEPELNQLLRDKMMREKFKVFSQREFSVENVLLYERYEEITSMKKRGSPATEGMLLDAFKQLYTDFMTLNGTFAININKKRIEEMNAAIEAKDYNSAFNVLEKTIEEISYLMTDTLSRFRKEQEYKEWNTKIQARRKTAGALGWDPSVLPQEKPAPTTPRTPRNAEEEAAIRADRRSRRLSRLLAPLSSMISQPEERLAPPSPASAASSRNTSSENLLPKDAQREAATSSPKIDLQIPSVPASPSS